VFILVFFYLIANRSETEKIWHRSRETSTNKVKYLHKSGDFDERGDKPHLEYKDNPFLKPHCFFTPEITKSVSDIRVLYENVHLREG
jgi:hypothetical protein